MARDSESDPESEPEGAPRGRHAKRPWQIPWEGWKDVLWRVWQEFVDDDVVDVAAGVAFYGLLALFPALIATVSIYGLLADPADIVNQVNRLTLAMPWTARSIIIDQLNEIQRGPDAGLRFSAISSLLIALFSASGGVAALMRGINKAYDERETRGWLRTRLLALGLTFGFATFFVFSVSAIALMPAIMDHLGLRAAARTWIELGRWPALAVATMLGLGILYRVAPNRTPPRWYWVGAGAVLATFIWTLASLSFALYAENFGRFNKTYGTLAGAIVLALWVFLSALAILLGAELNSELEHQTREDSTVGPARPMGERGAAAADELGAARPSLPQDPVSVGTRVRRTLTELNRPARGKGRSDDA